MEPQPVSPASQIESILLVSPRPVLLADMCAATELSAEEVEAAIPTLETKYSGESGILLRQVAGGYQLATNPSCAQSIERYRQESRPTPLSNAAHEVLSSALYMGPLTRGAISAIRGVNSDAVVRNLLERGLLAEAGTDDDSPGAPALITITEEFYAAVGAGSPGDFPPLESLVTEEELARVHERLGTEGESSAASPDGDAEDKQPRENDANGES
jgi:segregation and condensation protein B